MIELVCEYSPTREHEGSESLCEFCMEYVDATDEPCPGIALGAAELGQGDTHSVRADLCVWCLKYDLLPKASEEVTGEVD